MLRVAGHRAQQMEYTFAIKTEQQILVTSINYRCAKIIYQPLVVHDKMYTRSISKIYSGAPAM